MALDRILKPQLVLEMCRTSLSAEFSDSLLDLPEFKFTERHST
jgi:hypothetical protein